MRHRKRPKRRRRRGSRRSKTGNPGRNTKRGSNAQAGRDPAPGPDGDLAVDAGSQNSLAVTIDEFEGALFDRLRKAGAPEATIYAVYKTGLVIVEGWQHLATEAELDAWDAAIEEYETKVN